jgi:hypothetical protein
VESAWWSSNTNTVLWAKEQIMKAVETAWALGAAMVVTSWAWAVPAVQAGTKAERAAAENLVEETLRREAADGVKDRGELLEPAMATTPRYEPAYWQSGLIFDSTRKEWARWDDVQQRAAKDGRLIKYRQTREKYSESVDNQLALARWCREHKLPEQARAHLSRVLELNPNQAEARQDLGFRLVNGAWVDDHDAAEGRTSARKTLAAAVDWVARLEKLRGRLAGGNSQREKARKELLDISDPDAAQAIDAVFCRQSAEMALLGIEVLKDIRSPQAAAVLAWHAVFSPWPQVAQAAARALQGQEKYDYVPPLLHAAEIVDAQTQVANSAYTPGGAGPYGQGMKTVYRLDRVVNTYSWETVEHLKEHPRWQQVPDMRFDAYSPNPVAKKTTETVNQGADRTTTQKREYYTVTNDKLQDRHTETKVTVDKQVATPVGSVPYPPYARNAPTPPYQSPTNTPSSIISDTSTKKNSACAALAEATGEKGPQSPSDWWDWWYDYNEVYQSSSKRPDRVAAKASTSGGTQSQRGDCLAAGTLVSAESGPMAVEDIEVGDRIFCCDPETGSLALKPVLRKTVRPEGSLLKIRAGDDEFESSGGHVFWVAGRGWVKARDLCEGMQLHTIHGTVPVQGVEPGTSQKTFSLVAADFHTFFAGKEMILTHDNTIRPPTDRIVPGLADKTVPPANQ